MFKYIEVFCQDTKLLQKPVTDFTWASFSSQVGRAHLFSSIGHDEVTRCYKWGANFVSRAMINEAMINVLNNAARNAV